jgi:hypothetical protein
MIRRLIVAAALLASPGLAGPQLTTIQDVLYKADGTRFNGILIVSWTSFQAADNSAVVTQTTTVKVVDGILHVQLVPTTTSYPPAVYTVTYNSDGRVQFRETWSVPASVQPLRVRDVRLTGDAVAGDSGAALAESDVIGLIADLGSRPVKGPGYGAGRAVVVDAGGLLETATGAPADCLHVDGSSGPCGSGGGGGGAVGPAFIDADTLGGIVDGFNAVFALSAEPEPVASLSVYRNGMMQKAGLDYTLSGSTVTFVAGATPQPGDTLLASYRTALEGSDDAAVPSTASKVLCSGVGSTTNSAALAQLGTCAIPAGLLSPGDRVEIRFDFAHQGSSSGFSVEVRWGATPLVHRDAGNAEAMVTGRGDAAILPTGAALSVQSWGGSLALAAGAAPASDAYTSGLSVSFLGSVAQPGDSVSLSNFTVVRLP